MSLKQKVRAFFGMDQNPERAMVGINLSTGERTRYRGDEWLGVGVRCPSCGGDKFFDGPHGGFAVNVKCAGCGKCWWYGPPFKGIEDSGCYNQRRDPTTLDEII
jgi:hypothetical protein